MSPNYNPRGGDLPRRPTLGPINMPPPARTFGNLERREPPLSAICSRGECKLASSKNEQGDSIHPPCPGRCRLSSDPDKTDPILPKPPAFPKG